MYYKFTAYFAEHLTHFHSPTLYFTAIKTLDHCYCLFRSSQSSYDAAVNNYCKVNYQIFWINFAWSNAFCKISFLCLNVESKKVQLQCNYWLIKVYFMFFVNLWIRFFEIFYFLIIQKLTFCCRISFSASLAK